MIIPTWEQVHTFIFSKVPTRNARCLVAKVTSPQECMVVILIEVKCLLHWNGEVIIPDAGELSCRVVTLLVSQLPT